MHKLYCLVFSILLIEISVVQGTLEHKDIGSVLQELSKVLHDICVDRSGTNEATIKKIIDGDFVNDPKIKSYMKCLLMDSGGMNDHGELDADLMVEMLPPNLKENAAKILKKCDQKTKDISSLDEKAFAFLKCVYDSNPATFIFF